MYRGPAPIQQFCQLTTWTNSAVLSIEDLNQIGSSYYLRLEPALLLCRLETKTVLTIPLLENDCGFAIFTISKKVWYCRIYFLMSGLFQVIKIVLYDSYSSWFSSGWVVTFNLPSAYLKPHGSSNKRGPEPNQQFSWLRTWTKLAVLSISVRPEPALQFCLSYLYH